MSSRPFLLCHSGLRAGIQVNNKATPTAPDVRAPRRSGTPTFGSPPNQTPQRPVTPVIIQIPITYRATNVAILLRTLFILANNAGRTTRQAAFVRTGLAFGVILDTVHLAIITWL